MDGGDECTTNINVLNATELYILNGQNDSCQFFKIDFSQKLLNFFKN